MGKSKGRRPGPNPVGTLESALQYLLRHRTEREIVLLDAIVRFPAFDAAQRWVLREAMMPPREQVTSVARWLRLVGAATVPSAMLGMRPDLLTRTVDMARQLEEILKFVDERLASNPEIPSIESDGIAAVVSRESVRLGIVVPSGPEMAALAVWSRVEKPCGPNVDLRSAREQRWAQGLKRASRNSPDAKPK